MISSMSYSYWTIPRLEGIPFLVHGFGTTNWREDDLGKNPGWRDFRFISLEQIHSDIVHFVEKDTARNLRGDAVITDKPFRFLIIRSADCLPVFVVDESRRVIAACHCGWRGTQKRVVQRVVEGLRDHYRCSVSSLIVGLGPCIAKECYEVGEEILQGFTRKGLSVESFKSHPSREGKVFFDLRQANVSQLMDLGIQKENIHSLNICTHCQERFPSYRRDGKKTGYMLSFIGKKR